MDNDSCNDCGYAIPQHLTQCPHCGRPSLFPNVKQANTPAERQALQQRYQQAINSAGAAALPLLLQFENNVATQSQAVIARHASEVFQLAASENALYANFYQLVQAGVRMPSGDFWDAARAAVDSKLFNYYKEQIRFAALSLDGRGLNHYGDCFMTLKQHMIEHRASVFEENSVVFMHRLQIPVTAALPEGYLASWQERGRLAVAKLATMLAANGNAVDFPRLLLENGASAADDHFMEVHIFGSLSIHSVAEISWLNNGRGSAVKRKALQEKLKKLGIPLTQH